MIDDDLDEYGDPLPDPDDDEAWFRCTRCRREFSRPPLTIFSVEQTSQKVNWAVDLCTSCFSERTGLGTIWPPKRQRPPRTVPTKGHA